MYLSSDRYLETLSLHNKKRKKVQICTKSFKQFLRNHHRHINHHRCIKIPVRYFVYKYCFRFWSPETNKSRYKQREILYKLVIKLYGGERNRKFLNLLIETVNRIFSTYYVTLIRSFFNSFALSFIRKYLVWCTF